MTPQELKNSILQMAIQGKLVEQCPEEGTAEELYQQIQAEKQKLIKEKKIKKDKPLPEVTDDEKSFDIPDSWKWVRLVELGTFSSGKTPDMTNRAFWDGGTVNWMTSKDMKQKFLTESSMKITEVASNSMTLYSPGTLLMVVRSGILKRMLPICVLTQESTINQDLKAYSLIDLTMSSYIYYMLKALEPSILFNYTKRVTTVDSLKFDEFSRQMPVPLPPLAEQKRIVAKIEELLPLIDRYEAAWSRLEAFNKRFPEDMQKSLLQQAVQGKLVEQRPEEGTGEELYRQIQAEKQRLIAEKKIKKDKPLPEITDDEKPFEIPDSWKWVRLNSIAYQIGDIDHKMPSTVERDGVPYISPLNFTANGKIDYDGAKQISMDDYKKLSQKCTPSRNDIVFPRYGTIGILRLIDTDRKFLVSYSCCTIKNLEGYVYPKYVFYTLQSNMIKCEINRYINKTTQPNIGLQSIKNFLFPLPPLAEQKRIVAKIEQLLPLCDLLKK